MTRVIAKLWPEDRLRGFIHVMGFAIFSGTCAVAAYFFVDEAQVIWKEGPAFFFGDLAVRLVFGFVFALIALLPYFVGTVAAHRTKLSVLFFIVCAFVFIVDVWIRIDVLFFPESSTASLAIIFIPFYLVVPVLVIWALVAGGQALMKGNRGS